MERQLSETNPISQLYQDIWSMVSGMVIKSGAKVDMLESVEVRKYVDTYIDARKCTDIFEGYDYTQNEYEAVGILDINVIHDYQDNPLKVPISYRERLLKNKRIKIISEYNEPNDYYRMLAGLPPSLVIGGEIVNDVMALSLLVVPDDDVRTYNPDERVISLTSARKIMRTVLFEVGDHISVAGAVVQMRKTSDTRSFLITEDSEYIKDSECVLYYRDALTICIMLGLDTEYVGPGNYLLIQAKNLQDSTKIFNESYIVVPDNALSYDTSHMIKLSEALMNNPNSQIDDYILLNGYLYPSTEHEKIYGISTKVPMHEISKYYGDRFLVILESLGYLEELRNSHQGKEYRYVEFLGTKRIDILTSRSAKKFEILYLPESKMEITRRDFAVVYSGCRDYYMSTIYNYYYTEIYEYYENFISLGICQMAVQQLIARSEQAAINRDFYDSTMIKMLYDSYDIPYSSRLSQSTQNRILKNLNILIREKSSNKVIYDIATLLGYHDIQVYKYYLMKERRMDEDGRPVYYDTTAMGFVKDSDGRMQYSEIVVNDLEKMYDVYFQKVELNDTDYQKAFSNTANRVSYDEITMDDPLWWDDKDTFDALYGDATKFTAETEPEVYHKHYNYVESKYLGISIAYKLSEVVYEDILLLRMILEKKVEVGNIILTFPNITGTLEVSLFDTVVFLSAMLCKQSHISGEILTKVSTVLDVIGYMTVDADGYVPCDTLAFNFELAQNAETFKRIITGTKEYLSDAEEKQFESYLSILTIPNSDQKSKIEAFNKMYQNIKSMGYFITRKMSECTEIEEYRTWRDLYHALYTSKEIYNVFQIGQTNTVAKTYMEYLQTMNPRLYQAVDNCEDYMLFSYIDHVIYRMEQIIPDLKTMQAINDSNSSAHEYLKKLIRFFKSYTTDLINIDTQFIFDLKPDNLLKLTEHYHINQINGECDSFKLIYSDAMHSYIQSKEVDSISLKDVYYSRNTNQYVDVFPVNRVFKYGCVNPYCTYRCVENKDSCTKKESCKFYGYDTSRLYNLSRTYISKVLELGYPSNTDIQESIRAHLRYVGRLYESVDKYRFASDHTSDIDDAIARLSDTLVNLNNTLSAHNTGIEISTVGVEALSNLSHDLTSLEINSGLRICRNANYPCLTDDVCHSHMKEQYRFLEDLYHTDNILLTEAISSAVTYEFVRRLKLSEAVSMNMVVDYNSGEKIPVTEDISSQLINELRDDLCITDSYEIQQEISAHDNINFKEQIFFFYR